MHKSILMIILAVVSNSAMAEWVWVGKSEGNFTTYVDPTTIRKSGNKVKLWRLTDYKMAIKFTNGQYLSTKSQMQHDCMEEQFRMLYVTVYSENMGLGESSWNRKSC